MSNLPLHPLQSPEWGTFREKTGVEVLRIAPGFQMTLHPLPKLPWNIGYLPKCNMPDEEIIEKLKQIGKEKKCIFIKLEPNVLKPLKTIENPLNTLTKSSHPLFTPFTFHIDLTKSEDDLMKQMKSKTRYNIRVAQKHGVTVKEDNSDKAFDDYIRLSKKTWDRQKFSAHSESYHRKMWETLHPTGIAHLLIASYQSEKSDVNSQMSAVPLVAWILFLYKDVLYYPYGASSSKHRNVMASNLMMWEAMRWGKRNGAKLFDLWGSLGPDAEKPHPYYGFHRFKKGYGGKLVEFVGSYDLVLNKPLYQLYNLIHPIRQKLLGL